ncbi:MAG: DUF2029 domain-containing protein [Proteobacteria bacterium]|nr:DUF2029 domain-containing protein [Pseudomonadota bacterium]
MMKWLEKTNFHKKPLPDQGSLQGVLSLHSRVLAWPEFLIKTSKQFQRIWNCCGNYLLIAAAIFVILASVFGDLFRFFHSPQHHYDFYNSYQAARALYFGNDPYQSGSGWYIYPPFYAFLLLPLAPYSETFAHLFWLGVNLLLILLIIIWGLRVLTSIFQLTLNCWQAAGACALAILLSQDQIHQVFIQGQNDFLCLAGMALSFYWMERKPFSSGIGLGLAAAIKYQGIFFLPFLLFRARWRVALAMVMTMVTCELLPALIAGWGRNLNYLRFAFKGMANMGNGSGLANDQAARVPNVLWSGNISITSGLGRIFQAHHWSANSWLMVMILITLSVFLALRWMFQRQNIPFLYRTPRTLGNVHKEKMIFYLECCVLLLCMLILSPQCTRRHLALLLNVNLLASVMLLCPFSQIKRWPVLITILISQLALVRPPIPSLYFYVDYIGLPCWGYLFFLFVIIGQGLVYYRRTYYGAEQSNDNFVNLVKAIDKQAIS